MTMTWPWCLCVCVCVCVCVCASTIEVDFARSSSNSSTRKSKVSLSARLVVDSCFVHFWMAFFWLGRGATHSHLQRYYLLSTRWNWFTWFYFLFPSIDGSRSCSVPFGGTTVAAAFHQSRSHSTRLEMQI
uniref:Putative secreted peptide n=1 Tax=Anopheles braziliensis TaxID=58242 RepID=A0A2M3ZMX2_9DIPT